MDTQKNMNALHKPSSRRKKRLLGNLEISSFCDQMAMIISSGIPAYEGVSILLESAPDESTKEILDSIYTPLEAGKSLHEALRLSGVFPKYVLDMIEMGELCGRLEDVLFSLRDNYDREESIRSSIRNAVTYPIVIVCILSAIVLVMVSKVFPVFNQIYAGLEADLNGFPLILMNIGLFLNDHILFFLLLLVLLIIGGLFLFNSNTGKILFQGRSLSMSIAACRFANCMSMTLSSGLDTNQGLDFAMRLVDNPHMEERIRRCIDFSNSGQSFSSSMIAAGIFDKLYSSMITIAARTGSLEQIMKKLSKEYEAAIERKIVHFITILEPALIIILSFIIGLILISYLLPLVGIISGIG